MSDPDVTLPDLTGDCPLLAWPDLPDSEARLSWYRAVIVAYASLWEGHSSESHLAPVGESALSDLEARLGCALPPTLRRYHRELGALNLAETLCGVDVDGLRIEPLLDAYPGIVDIDEDMDLALAKELIAFGDYLGNGNMFCFHRQSGEVYYFDHDDGAPLTRFFPSVEQYLDALMMLCIAEVRDDDEGGETLLAERFGEHLVKKWRY